MSVTAGPSAATVELCEIEVLDLVRALNRRLSVSLDLGGRTALDDAATIAQRIVDLVEAHRATTPQPPPRHLPNPGGS